MKAWISYLLIAVVVTGCGGGSTSAVKTNPDPEISVVATTYSGSTQTTTYSDGSTATVSAITSPVTWDSDHVTKTTTYIFPDGTTNPVNETVDPIETITYAVDEQTVTLTYGDTYVASTVNTTSTSAETWDSDHVTKTTTYTFPDDTTNVVVETVDPVDSAPVLTNAIYPEDFGANVFAVVIAPQVTPIIRTYGDGFEVTLQNGDTLSFDQDTLDAANIFDPNAKVSSATTTYDLHWGTPDPDGDFYASLYDYGDAGSLSFPAPIEWFGSTMSGPCFLCGPTILAPHPDVTNAWFNGWTGDGVEVIVADFFTGVTVDDYSHGLTVSMIAATIAPGATIRAIDLNDDTYQVINEDWVYAAPAEEVVVGVVNASFGVNYSDPDLTRAEADTYSQLWIETVVSVLRGDTGYYYNFNFSDTVITKSAGNESFNDWIDGQVRALLEDSQTVKRLLVVGATLWDGSPEIPTDIADYSNMPTSNTDLQERFLLADGTTPFYSGGVFYDDVLQLYGEGTSFAAPRVAGYVAILRHKFPNLTGEQSASVLLDTARYDTLACYYGDGCDPAIYGQGEASLSYALSPVGLLR